MNWLERARSEIVKSVEWPTANTDETPVLAVLAVPHPSISKKSGGVPQAESARERTLPHFHLSADYRLH